MLESARRHLIKGKRKKKKWLVMERWRIRTASSTASSARSWLLATLTVNKSGTSLHLNDLHSVHKNLL